MKQLQRLQTEADRFSPTQETGVFHIYTEDSLHEGPPEASAVLFMLSSEAIQNTDVLSVTCFLKTWVAILEIQTLCNFKLLVL